MTPSNFVHTIESLSSISPHPPAPSVVLPGPPEETWLYTNSLVSGRPISIRVPRSVLGRASAALAAIDPPELPPMAKLRGHALLPRELLRSVETQHFTTRPERNIRAWQELTRKLTKCQDCATAPEIMYTSPGTGCFIDSRTAVSASARPACS